MLDSALTDLLVASDKLFSPGKFKNFGPKIEHAFGLGLIHNEERTYLNALRDIRNAFAHDAAVYHFEHDEKVMRALRSIPPKGEPPQISIRDHLGTVCSSLYVALTTRTRSSEA